MADTASTTVSKQQRAFYRKLYLSYLISQQAHSLTSLQQLTGMPRRTIQDCLKDLGDIGVQCSFIQQEGGRHNAGHYQLDDWGPIRPAWVAQHLTEIEQLLAG
ncbi:helix-turn-helix domain-containing protein [Marinobacterium arenosum]|uniref:helix-turn-helix domain-containing protein n=1 Tax=Marinobacterium arenosum TaxID=2862496 RepID=UPI001C98702B|nr:helix-turn-helix domain-containing protein [Marinobacterium arenosum]MBY4678510.1 winged helix-turn-helix domain-containing protein [Marinobacterium arenosum]